MMSFNPKAPEPAGGGPDVQIHRLAKYIDHTNLQPTASESDIRKLCDEVLTQGFYSACVSPRWVKLVAREFEDTGAKVCTVIGFPHGVNTPHTKAEEAINALRFGAHELDMVMPYGAMLERDFEYVKRDISTVVDAAVRENSRAFVKVILETGALKDLELIRKACELAIDAGAHCVKTSTGFYEKTGATEEHVRLMFETVQKASRGRGSVIVKASGGIGDAATAEKMIAAGAMRLGCSKSMAIVAQASTGDASNY